MPPLAPATLWLQLPVTSDPAESPLNEPLRAQLLEAVNALSDRGIQERLWVRGERQSPRELSFDDAVLFVIDQLQTADPAELVGHVLRDETELDAFSRLSRSLNKLVDEIGADGSFEDAVESGQAWIDCTSAARALQALASA